MMSTETVIVSPTLDPASPLLGGSPAPSEALPAQHLAAISALAFAAQESREALASVRAECDRRVAAAEAALREKSEENIELWRAVEEARRAAAAASRERDAAVAKMKEMAAECGARAAESRESVRKVTTQTQLLSKALATATWQNAQLAEARKELQRQQQQQQGCPAARPAEVSQQAEETLRREAAEAKEWANELQASLGAAAQQIAGLLERVSQLEQDRDAMLDSNYAYEAALVGVEDRMQESIRMESHRRQSAETRADRLQRRVDELERRLVHALARRAGDDDDDVVAAAVKL
eukprot:m51a1_g9580 hypothetical protein (295) ;mRNA; r:981880-983111